MPWLSQCLFEPIMHSVSTDSYSILSNGEPCSHLNLQKVLCKVTHYLRICFVISIEYFRCISDAKEQNNFTFHPRCRRNKIPLLLFVNDLVLFFSGDVEFVQVLHEAFQKFSRASTLQVTMDKCNLYLVFQQIRRKLK